MNERLADLLRVTKNKIHYQGMTCEVLGITPTQVVIHKPAFLSSRNDWIPLEVAVIAAEKYVKENLGERILLKHEEAHSS